MVVMDTDEVAFAKALADETRQQIMKHLCCAWLSVTDVVEKLEGRVNQPTVSHHLKKLAEAGLVSVRRDGRQRFYTLDQDRLTVCCGRLVQRFAPDYAGAVQGKQKLGDEV
jgi:ArsR family transcriptional regulator